MTLQLLPKVGKVYGLDPFKGMLDNFEADVASTSLRNFEVCSGTIGVTVGDFTFPPSDIVTSSLSIHHTPSIKGALQAISNALKPGEQVIVLEVVAHAINLDGFASRESRAT
jgi:ubiquinone/menaquinone biosynthesis C-methylase UbiE